MGTTEIMTEIATEVVTDYHGQFQQAFKDGLYSGLWEGIKFFFTPEILPYMIGIVLLAILCKMMDSFVLKKKRERQKKERIEEMKEFMEEIRK